MFSHEYLHCIRNDELSVLAKYLGPEGTLLELGAGTGFQARGLADLGYEVKAIDLPGSAHKASRVFPVVDYDGRTIPFPDATFDVVFSSNVLEHVVDLPAMLAETRRVLKPGGHAVHAMPTAMWRLWTSVAGPLDCLPFITASLAGRAPQSAIRRSAPVAFIRGVAARWIPRAHGETGNALTELVTFSKRRWVTQFEQNGFRVVRAEPMNLFYTGWSVLGHRMPIETRKKLARMLGSACYVYEVRPA